MSRDFTKIYKSYKGKWVALSPDENKVLAAGNTLKKILDSAKKKGHTHPIVMKIPPSVVPYVGSPFSQ